MLKHNIDVCRLSNFCGVRYRCENGRVCFGLISRNMKLGNETECIPRVMTSTSVCLLHNDVFLSSVHEEQQEECDEKENAVHDTKCERCLEHCARLVDVGRKWRVSAKSVGSERYIDAIVGEIRAILIGYATELIDARYEGSNETKVDESYEVGGVPG